MPHDNDQRRLWAHAGYRTNLGSAATGSPPEKEYIRLYKVCKTEHALSNVRHSRLKLATGEDLNDPFELRALSFPNATVRVSVKQFTNKYWADNGLLCFSEDWTSPVLWSHYGDGHRGVCLGYDVRRSACRKVIYRSKRLEKVLPKDEDTEFELSTSLRRLLAKTKSGEWRYEQERRIVAPRAAAISENNMLFWKMDQTVKLREIILGPKSNLDLADVRAIAARNKYVKTFKARLAWKHFKVVPLETSVP